MTPEIRHGRLPARGPVGNILRLVGIVAAVALASTVSLAAVAVNSLSQNLGAGIDLGVTAPPLSAGGIAGIGSISQPVNILIVGSDSGGGNIDYGVRSGARSDVQILLHISPTQHTATAISIPRDLDYSIPSCPNPAGGTYPAIGLTKINSALNNGLACTVKTISQLTGLDIPYAGVIEFDGVVAMSNAIGGVDVCVATAIYDSKINSVTPFKLSAGQHTLQGADALNFLRSRYGVGDGSDLTRISNQQQFLSSLLRKVKSAGVLTNPVTLYALAQAATSNMALSTSLNRPDTMVSIALALKDIDLSQMVFVQYPTAIAGAQLLPRTADAAVLMDAIKNDQPVTVSATGGGTTAATPAPVASPAPTSSAPATAAPLPTSSAVALPSTVTGQNAAETTCTKGQRY